MAKSVWGIELGTSSIKAVKLASGPEGIEILALDTLELIPEEGYSDDRNELLLTALGNLRDAHGIKPSEPVFVSIPGHQTLNRLIPITVLNKKTFRQTIALEVKQQLPLDISEVIWDYQIVGGDSEIEEGQEVQVSVFAARETHVRDYLNLLAEAKLSVSGVQVAPVSIYNFIKYDQKFPKAGIVVDIGANNTDVVVIDSGKIWIRTIPQGGNQVTEVLKRRFKLDEDKAEELKLKAGQSKQAQQIFGVMKEPLKELLSEISRSVGYYKQQHPNVNLNYMMLMGSGSHLLGLKKFFEQQLQHRVDRLTRPAKIRISRDLDSEAAQRLTENFATLGVSLGLALQAAGAADNNVNLVPQEVKTEALVARKFPSVVIAAIIMIVAGILPMFGVGSLTADAADANDAYERAERLVRDIGGEYEDIPAIGPVRTEMARFSTALRGYTAAAVGQRALHGMTTSPDEVIERTLRNNRSRTLNLFSPDFMAGLFGGGEGYDRQHLYRKLGRARLVWGMERLFSELDQNNDNMLTQAGDPGASRVQLSAVNYTPRSTPKITYMGPMDQEVQQDKVGSMPEIAGAGLNGLTERQFLRVREQREFPADPMDERGLELMHYYNSGVFAGQVDIAIPFDEVSDAMFGDVQADMIRLLEANATAAIEEAIEAMEAAQPGSTNGLTYAATVSVVKTGRPISDTELFTGRAAPARQGTAVISLDYRKFSVLVVIRQNDPRISRPRATVNAEDGTVSADFSTALVDASSATAVQALASQRFLLVTNSEQVELEVAMGDDGAPAVRANGSTVTIRFNMNNGGGSLRGDTATARVYAP